MGEVGPLTLDRKCLDLLLMHINGKESVTAVSKILVDCVHNVTPDNINTVIHSLDILSVLLSQIAKSTREDYISSPGDGIYDENRQDLLRQGKNAQKLSEIKDIYVNIVNSIIIPLLNSLTNNNLPGTLISRCFTSILNIVSELCLYPSCLCDLVEISYQLVKDNTTNSKFSHCADHDSELVTVLMHIELLTKAFRSCEKKANWYETFRVKLFNEITRAMVLANDKVVARIFGALLPVLIGETLKKTHVSLIWNAVLDCHRDSSCSNAMQSSGFLSERPIFLICSAADIFFPATGFPSAVLTLLHEPDFWHILQSGFFHTSSLTRKRAMYLLKRLLDVINTQNMEIKPEENKQPVFWWTASEKVQLSEVWMNFILLAETLEEKQVHVIRPLMPRFQFLVNAASHESGSNTGKRLLLHTSWLLCLAQRAASHDNSHVQRWIVQQILELPFQSCPLFSQGQKTFFCGALVKMLSVSSLYHRPSDTLLGQCPPVADSVVLFFKNVTESLDVESKVSFIRDFLKGLLLQSWGGGPLVYIVRGLAQLTDSSLIKDDTIPIIRDVILSPMSTLQASFRSAIQYYVMVFVTKCIDLDSVSLASFCSLLACLRAGEVWKRGTDFYQLLVNQLCKAGTKSQMWSGEKIQNHLQAAIQSYVCNCSQEGNKEDTLDSMYQQSLQIVRLLVLAYDAQIINTSKDSPILQMLLAVPLDIIASMNSHAYISLPKVHKSFMLLTVLLQECDTIFVCDNLALEKDVKQVIDTNVHEILLFIERQISEVTQVTPVSYIDLYCNLLEAMGYSYSKELCASSHVVSLVDLCVKTAEQERTADQPRLLLLYSTVRILATLSRMLQTNMDMWQLTWTTKLLHFCDNWHIVQRLPRPGGQNDEPSSGSLLNDNRSWGRTASRFLACQWTCISACLVYRHGQCLEETHRFITMDDCLTSLDLMSSDDVIPVLQSMVYFFRNVSEESKCHVIHVTWHKILEALRDASFWSAFDVFLDMTLQAEVLDMDPDSCIGKCISQLLTELFELGEEKQGVVYKTISHLCKWAQTDNNTLRQSVRYIDKLITAIMFGPVHSRGKRFVNEVIQFLKHQTQLPGNQLLKSTYKADAAPRVQVLSLLAALDPNDPVQKSFLHTFLRQLMTKYKEEANLSAYRNYINSLTHRHKHRIFSALLILEPAVDEEILPEVFKFLQEMLVKESQPSVRCMVEWFILLLINRWSHLMDTIWNALSEGSEKKPAFLCSLLTIAAHVNKVICDEEKKRQFIDKGLQEVLPWCMAHQFNVRTYGQAALFSMWELCKKNKLENIITKHSIIDSFMHFAKHNRTACKSTFKLMDNFFFTFHPIQDYSIETIVHTLPMLTCMTDEEWIPVTLFPEIDSRWQQQVYRVPLYNASEELKHSKPGTWRVKNSAHDVEEVIGDAALSCDVQKKMIPWRMMLPETELNPEMLIEYSKKQHKTGGLVIVTSLVDKIPNLGGLCRTAEIFGASEFVIGNLSYIDDQGFRSLSVSAHQWIPITEVSCGRLKDYLREMKAAGYTLVGAEQTAQSHCLTKFNFPEKSLLLLGNEKEGIPVDLIQLLDACVEIPQQGIIRSLNVHVSGALLIWEYTRQQLLKTP